MPAIHRRYGLGRRKGIDQMLHAILSADGTRNRGHDREQDRDMRAKPLAQIAHHEREWAVCVARKIVHVSCKTCWRLTRIVSGPPFEALDVDHRGACCVPGTTISQRVLSEVW